MTCHVLIFSGGPIPRSLPEFDVDFVVAADHGADHAVENGYQVDVLVGDLDSVTQAGRNSAKKVVQHPVDKDVTDLELALEESSKLGATQVTVVGTFQGRVDHSFNNLLVLVNEQWAHMSLSMVVDDSHVWIVHNSLEVVVPGGGFNVLYILAKPPIPVNNGLGVNFCVGEPGIAPDTVP